MSTCFSVVRSFAGLRSAWRSLCFIRLSKSWKPKVAQMRLQNGTCQDMPPDEDWRSFWTLYPSVLSSFYGRDVTQTTFYLNMNRTIHSMLAGGCPALAQDPVEFLTGASWCQGMPSLFRPLAVVCPVTCGCNTADAELPSYCPPSCMRPPGSNSSA